ncbi:hypothetical protein [Pontibacter cellulosilyticus]|uniref:Uncharacterized protein n=1 Tax=Pontibacter cellulosilyticus TaxID=1720253 RepID=A0A923SK11_9BACT|nr:hypothetical protein [Pontibacter cellulosilyticus]MBC5994388.1 hypothetical protein [Pontibacter cellulosilyticus]
MQNIFSLPLFNKPGLPIVIATIAFAAAIQVLFDFLWFGRQLPAQTWGMKANKGFQLIEAKAVLFLLLLPSISISLLVLAFSRFGYCLHSAYNSKTPISNG